MKLYNPFKAHVTVVDGWWVIRRRGLWWWLYLDSQELFWWAFLGQEYYRFGSRDEAVERLAEYAKEAKVITMKEVTAKPKEPVR